ncbi:MAG TPA: class D sortase [Clostridiaceae bacterium]
MKIKILKPLGIILIVIGLGIISYAIYARVSTQMKQKEMIDDFQKTLQQGEIIDQAGGGELATPDVDSSPNQAAPKDTKGGTIGIMTIPKIDLKVAISEGSDLATLKYAVGHFEGTAMPGETGNSSFAGHRSYTYSEYFNRLDELTNGDSIIVQTKKGIFTYIVYKKLVVEPSEVSVLDATADAEITLVTCTPIRVATHRLIIKGKLKK